MPLDLDRLRAVASRVRNKADPIRTTSVVVRRRTWDGGAAGDGDPTDVDVNLGPTKARHLRAREITESGGKFEEGAVAVGPIDPNFTAQGGGGFTIAQLDPSGSSTVEIFWILSGAISGTYKLVYLDDAKPFRYIAILNRTRLTP